MAEYDTVLAYLSPGHVAHEFLESMVDMLAYDFGGDHRISGRIGVTAGVNVNTSRNKVVEDFLERTDGQWLLWLDSDMTFLPNTLQRLLEAADPIERPIIGGLYFGLSAQSADALYRRDWEVYPQMFIATEDGEPGRLFDFPPNTLQRVLACGTGCLLVHRDVYESMAKKYPKPWPWFAESVFDEQPIGEDVTFCIRAGALGFPVYVHTGVILGHKKEWIVEATEHARLKPTGPSRLRPKKLAAVE